MCQCGWRCVTGGRRTRTSVLVCGGRCVATIAKGGLVINV